MKMSREAGKTGVEEMDDRLKCNLAAWPMGGMTHTTIYDAAQTITPLHTLRPDLLLL